MAKIFEEPQGFFSDELQKKYKIGEYYEPETEENNSEIRRNYTIDDFADRWTSPSFSEIVLPSRKENESGNDK